jgi:hypothetical protein
VDERVTIMKQRLNKITTDHRRLIFVLLAIVSLASVTDVMGLRILSFIGPDYSVRFSVYSFAAVFCLVMIGWVIVLGVTSSQPKYYGSFKKPLKILYRVTGIIPFAGSFAIVVIIFQALYYSSYSVILIPLATFGSYIPAVIILSILIFKLLRWFRIKRDYIMLSYTIAMTTILINAALLIVNFPTELFDTSVQINATTIQSTITKTGNPHQSFQEIYEWTSFFSFLSTWVATALLLRNYSRKTGQVIYWILVVSPLLYFLGQYPAVFDYLFSDLRYSDPTIYAKVYTLFFGLTRTVGGIFFAIGFWIMAKNIDNAAVKSYLNYAGYGILLVFIATQANSVIISPYPPFGIVALSSMGLASHLVFVGIYYTALSIASETSLRVEINKKVHQMALLGKIGTAQMEQRLLNDVLPIMERTLEKEEKIPNSLEEEDIKLFIRQALNEVKKRPRPEI